MLIAFIGGGNMATALISGLLKAGRQGLEIRVADPSEEARKRMRSDFGISVAEHATGVTDDADVIVLAVKPQVVPAVLTQLAGNLASGQLVLSIAAGTTIADITAGLGADLPVVRAMPNTPALVGAGITGVCSSAACKPHHREQAERILKSAGRVVWIENESLMDAVTAVSGSGPAYFFLLTEALAEAGERLGLPADTARLLAETTCTGAGAMLDSTSEGAAVLRQRVTSPGGTTQAALDALAEGGFRNLVFRAAEAAERRGKELAGTAATGGRA
jgi:pyrroline-5-carboxylate reductase